MSEFLILPSFLISMGLMVGVSITHEHDNTCRHQVFQLGSTHANAEHTSVKAYNASLMVSTSTPYPVPRAKGSLVPDERPIHGYSPMLNNDGYAVAQQCGYRSSLFHLCTFPFRLHTLTMSGALKWDFH